MSMAGRNGETVSPLCAKDVVISLILAFVGLCLVGGDGLMRTVVCSTNRPLFSMVLKRILDSPLGERICAP